MVLTASSEAVHNPFHSLAKVGHIEVDQQADLPAAEFQVGQQLRRVERDQLLNGFQLHNDAAFDEKIDSVACVQSDVLVNHWEPDLVLETQAVDGELIVKASLIRALKESGAKRGVDLHCGVDNSACDVFVQHIVPSSCSPVSPVVESVRKQMEIQH